MEIRINEKDQLALLKELEHRTHQRDELQIRCTQLEFENRDMRYLLRRVAELPPRDKHDSDRYEALSPNEQQEFIEEEKRRSNLWLRLRSAYVAYLEGK